MLDTLTSQNHRDFGARYGGTFGWYLGDKKRILVSVQSVDAQRVRFVDRHAGEYFSLADSGIQFEFIPVDRGFFNGPYNTYLLQRTPQRQWHRGISAGNTNAYNLGVDIRRRAHRFTGWPMGFDLLHDIFDKQVDHATAWQQLVKKDRPSMALSKHFAIAGDEVLFFREVIGSVRDNTITLESTLVEQEVRDAVRRNQIPLEVKVSNG